MANTTFNGPVRSEGGFEQITKNSTTGAITTNLDVDTSGNISTTGTVNNLLSVTSVTDATLTPTCLLYTSPSPRDVEESRMPSSA